MEFIIYSSTLTIRILKSRYLSHVQGDTLSPEAKKFMKKVVQEEILKMQVPDVSNAFGRFFFGFVRFVFSIDLSERTMTVVKVRWRTKGLRKKGKEQMSS